MGLIIFLTEFLYFFILSTLFLIFGYMFLEFYKFLTVLLCDN